MQQSNMSGSVSNSNEIYEGMENSIAHYDVEGNSVIVSVAR